MNQQRFSSIAHGTLRYWNPVSVDHVERYVDQLNLTNQCACLDIGCGTANLLQRVVTRYQATGVGVDSSPFAIERASELLRSTADEWRVRLLHQSFDATAFEPASFELVMCIGSTHACGGYDQTLASASRLLRPDGLLLVGQGYWKCPPPHEYLTFLQATADELGTFESNQTAGARHDLELIDCSECSLAEWDAYENQYAENVERYVSTHDDPDGPAMLDKIRTWHAGYDRWGRETLGFGLYLFRNAGSTGGPR